MANYDDWKSDEPDEDRWHRSVPCQKIGCTNPVTFPDFEVYCSFCIAEAEERKRRQWAEIQAYEQVRRA